MMSGGEENSVVPPTPGLGLVSLEGLDDYTELRAIEFRTVVLVRHESVGQVQGLAGGLCSDGLALPEG